MAKTLKDLLLALLNATLILLALCLFLGWKLAQSVDNIRTGFAENLQLVTPLRDQAQGLRGELAALRSDMVAIRAQDDASDPATARQLNAALQRLNGLQEGLEKTQARLTGLVDSPEDLIDHAITTTVDSVTHGLQSVRGCTPAT